MKGDMVMCELFNKKCGGLDQKLDGEHFQTIPIMYLSRIIIL